MIGDIISFSLQSIIVFYLAFVLYKASQSVKKVHDPLLEEQVSMLVYIQNMSNARRLLGPSLPGSTLESVLSRNRAYRNNSLFSGDQESMNPDREVDSNLQFDEAYTKFAKRNVLSVTQATNVWGKRQMQLREGMLSVFVMDKNVEGVSFVNAGSNDQSSPIQ